MWRRLELVTAEIRRSRAYGYGPAVLVIVMLRETWSFSLNPVQGPLRSYLHSAAQGHAWAAETKLAVHRK